MCRRCVEFDGHVICLGTRVRKFWSCVVISNKQLKEEQEEVVQLHEFNKKTQHTIFFGNQVSAGLATYAILRTLSASLALWSVVGFFWPLKAKWKCKKVFRKRQKIQL